LVEVPLRDLSPAYLRGCRSQSMPSPRLPRADGSRDCHHPVNGQNEERREGSSMVTLANAKTSGKNIQFIRI
jgi:hypothetical protein